MRPDEEFAPLSIIKKNLTDFNRCAYRVYKSPAEFVTVEAATALEAFRESGIKNPFRILRETRFMERLVDQNRFTATDELISTGFVMEPPVAITGHQEAVPQVVRAAEELYQTEEEPAEELLVEAEESDAEILEEEDALSPDDVAKLLGDNTE